MSPENPSLLRTARSAELRHVAIAHATTQMPTAHTLVLRRWRISSFPPLALIVAGGKMLPPFVSLQRLGVVKRLLLDPPSVSDVDHETSKGATYLRRD